MTDKERLEEIGKNLDPLGYGMGGHLISVNDIYWLVRYAKKQAERVEELESEIENWQEGRFLAVSTFIKEIDLKERVQELEELVEGYKIELMIKDNAKKRANQQNKRYREALEFYANKINYLTFIENGKSNIEHDQGEKARKALEGEK